MILRIFLDFPFVAILIETFLRILFYVMTLRLNQMQIYNLHYPFFIRYDLVLVEVAAGER